MTFQALSPLSPWTSDVQTSYGFEPTFFDGTHADERRVHVGQSASGTGPANAPERPPGYDVLDLADVFCKLNKAFLDSDAGRQARDEWAATHQEILDFAQANRLRKAQGQLLALLKFRHDHRGPRVNGEIELYRPDYKPRLEALARHLRNDRIRLEDRCDALERLEGLDLCAARHRAEIGREAMRLHGLGGGLGAAVWSAFSEMGLAHLMTLLRAEPRLAHLDFTTPHALHPFAAALRLPGHSLPSEENDAYVVDTRIVADVVKRCGVALERSLGMTTIAQHLADECLREVRETLARKTGGAALDLCHGHGHWGWLLETVQALAGRFGDLHPCDVVGLGVDGMPRGLTDDTRILAIRIRLNMARQHIAPAPTQQLLEQRVVDGESRRFLWFEGQWPYVVIDGNGDHATPRLRLPTLLEIDDLRRPSRGPSGRPAHRLDEQGRQALAAFASLLPATAADPVATRERVAASPTAEGLQAVIERQGLDDDAVAAWLKDAAPRWDAPALDYALKLLIGGRRAAPLAALLTGWRAEGFTDSWQRCVRDQAVRSRTHNTDLRIQGRDEGGDIDDGEGTLRAALVFGQEAGRSRSLGFGAGPQRPQRPQQLLLDRLERQFRDVVPLAATRARLREFRHRHPPGGDRSSEVVAPDLFDTIDGLRTLLAGPARLLSVPLLAEDAGMSEALDSSLFGHADGRFKDELALVYNMANGLALSPEQTVALLQVTSNDRVPVPSPLVSTVLLMGKAFVVDALFDWTTELFQKGMLDASAAKRLLLPDAWEAERAPSTVSGAPIVRTLTRYLERLDAACNAGVLNPFDLAVAAGASSDQPSNLLLAAAKSGREPAVKRLEEWRSTFR